VRPRLAAWLAVGLLAWAGSPAQAQAPTPIPVADFFRPPQLGESELSPSGRYLALQVLPKSGRQNVAVFDLDNPGKYKIVAGFTDLDIEDIAWINDTRLVFDTTDRSKAPWFWGRGVGEKYAVNWDGSELRPAYTGRVQRYLDDGSEDVIGTYGTGTGSSLFRINTRTGTTKDLTGLRPAHIYRWVLDEKGVVRAVGTAHESTERLYRYDAGPDKWVVVSEGDSYLGGAADPVGFRYGQMYVRDVIAGRQGTSGVFRFDLQTGKREAEPLVRIDGFDFRGGLLFDDASQRLIGVSHQTDAWSTTWLDPQMKEIQVAIDAALPGMSNMISCGRSCLGARRLVVVSSSDRQPVMFSYYDRETRKVQVIGRSRPWIEPERMGQRDFFRVRARDGLDIPVYVTTPAGRKPERPLPAVVLVHGGPWLRGSDWSWQAEAQFLASRGYLVLQPEFRGSEGFGFAHFQAGWKQWGLAMNDDLADVARWAIEKKWVDPARVCLAGASYGGYATLMGLARDPELFRCGVSWLAPTDIDEMYAMGWSDLSVAYLKHGLPRLVADRRKDAEQIKVTSPLRQAARIKQPVLLAYGADDRRVPIEHGEQMRDALERHNRDVEWIRYPYEGHGWFLLANEVDFWSRVEQFLAKHIGTAKAP
jgi:dienelactone hydrolase